MSCESPIVKFPFVWLALHLSLGELLTKYVAQPHDDFAAKYATVVAALAVNTIRPPASLKYTAKIDVGDENLTTSAPSHPKTVTDKSEIVGKITKIGYDEMVTSSCCAATNDTESRLFPLISTVRGLGLRLATGVRLMVPVREGDFDRFASGVREAHSASSASPAV
jgi:hypothetical protein